ncbi:MAG TPA: YkgJ family cysteine cluster protein [Polyangiaceae bacterium]
MSEQTPPKDDREAQLAAFRGGLNARESGLLDAQRRVASERLAARDPALVLAAAACALGSSEELRRYHLEVLQPAAQIACHDGCHWCCHLKVSVTAPEVFAVAHYLGISAPQAVRERVKARAAELATDPRIFSSDAKAEAHIPCAMLTEQGGCSVYAARPLTCRGYNALDSESCRRMLDDDQEFVASNDAWARECAAESLGFRAAIAEAGLPAELLELTSALHIALSEPNALQRWLAGEPIFAAALADR